MTDHPITPPPDLLQQWAVDYWGNPGESIGAGEKYIATQAARWGADQELEACCEWLIANDNPRWAVALQEGRRPKPPSLAEEALDALNEIEDKMLGPTIEEKLIRRALERLQELDK